MTHSLRFFDDYGSGWHWPGDDAARARFGLGPLTDQPEALLSTQARDLAEHLLVRSPASFDPEYPPDGCKWPFGERRTFDLAADGLLTRRQAALGAGYGILDKRRRLAE